MRPIPFVGRPVALNMYNPDNGPALSATSLCRSLPRGAGGCAIERITDWCLCRTRLGSRPAAASHLRKLHDEPGRGPTPATWTPRSTRPTALDRCLLARVTPSGANSLALRHRAWLARCALWLSMWSLRHVVVSAEPHLKQIAVPSLVVQGTADTGGVPGRRPSHPRRAGRDRQGTALRRWRPLPPRTRQRPTGRGRPHR